MARRRRTSCQVYCTTMCIALYAWVNVYEVDLKAAGISERVLSELWGQLEHVPGGYLSSRGHEDDVLTNGDNLTNGDKSLIFGHNL